MTPPPDGWNLERVIRAAQRLRGGRRRPPLIGFDAPIGVPRSFIDAASARSFRGWLNRRCGMDRFEPCRTLDEWSVCRPFFAVPKGVGSRTAFEARMQAGGVEPLRRIEEVVQGKPAFVTSGIPGAVGCSVIDLWRDIPRHRRNIALWPFDGSLCGLRRCREPVVAEIYPRAAYGLAIGTQPPSKRPRITVAKNRAEMRGAFLSLLASPDRWVRRQGIQLCDLDEACRSGDAFDALVAAAALLRCVLERTPLSDPRYEDAVAEGGILGSGSVCLDLPEQSFRPET